MIDELLKIAADEKRPVEVRTDVVHTLGWYDISYRRADIAKTLGLIKTDDQKLNTELKRSLRRLQGIRDFLSRSLP